MLEVAVTVGVCAAFVMTGLIPLRETVCAVAFSLIVTLLNVLSVGAWFTALTVTVNVRLRVLFVVPPSFTVTVMVAVPNPYATGEKLKDPVAFGLV